MASKTVAAVFLLITIGVCGEKPLTGNINYDLLHAVQDTVPIVPNEDMEGRIFMNPLMVSGYSFLLPGSGQYLLKEYTRSIIYAAIEIGAITTAIIFNGKGNSKTTEFQNYADLHWSPVRYAQWINKYGVADYGPTGNIDIAKVSVNDFREINAWEQGLHSTGFSHSLPAYGEQQYFELIGKYNQYKFGWDTYPLDGQGIPISDGGKYDDLIPQQMKDYAAERGKANDYYTAAKTAVAVVVLNHVVSALDALLSTRVYNKGISNSVSMDMRRVGNRYVLIPTAHLALQL